MAAARLTHPKYADDPWISLGCGAKTPATIDTSVDAVSGPTGSSPLSSVDIGGAMHVDAKYHCVDGSVYNLLRTRFPHFAVKAASRLNDDEFRRMQLSELGSWFHREIPHLQMRYIEADDMLEHLRNKVRNEISELIVVETMSDSGHCLAVDTGLNTMSDVASGKVVAITADDVLTQLDETGLRRKAMVIELTPEPQPERVKKRRGKNRSHGSRRKAKVM